MKFCIILAASVAIVYGANHLCWTVDQISDHIIELADTNKDGIVTMEEFNSELINDWGLSNDTCLSYHQFMQEWMANFHDHHDTTHAFFAKLDFDNDNQLCEVDVLVQMIRFDTNPMDGQIQPAEMNAFMHAVHPDSHHNSAHGNGC